MDCVSFLTDIARYEGAKVIFRVRMTGERAVVSLFKSATTEASGQETEGLPLADELIRLLGRFVTDTDEHERGRAMALAPIYQALEPVIPELEAAARTSTTGVAPYQTPSLHNMLYPKAWHYRLVSTPQENEPFVVPIQPGEAYFGAIEYPQAVVDNHAEFQTDSSLPRYSTHRVRVIRAIVDHRGAVCIVTVDGQQLFCKASRESVTASVSLGHEIELLQKIMRYAPILAGGQSSTNCQVPRLRGYVEHPETGKILGYLQDWVPARYSLEAMNGTGLGDMDVPRAMRERWGGQIERTIMTLHAMGVAWGDATPCNVLIDVFGDAWILNFGSGRNYEWDVESFQETVRRDVKGLTALVNLLAVDV